MIGYCNTAVPAGADVVPIRVEAHVRPGKPKFQLIGLGDSAVKESRERVSAALHAANFDVPDQILINLAPADVKKSGSGLELAMAWAVLVASEQAEELDSTWVFGELSLDGELKPVRSIAGLTSRAALSGIRRVVVPIENESEAMLVEGLDVLGVASLSELFALLKSGEVPTRRREDFEGESFVHKGFEDVHGQFVAKRAFEIAASGGHNVLLIGPPGCGKSMLAERLSSLLPPLRREERLAIAQIASGIGEPIDDYLRGRRPFRSPHHVVSEVGLMGGGADLRPGEVSLAHGGVLFLDEFPEFPRRTIEALRAPLEARKVTITRAIGSATYPAAFQLIAAMNPCPCGRLGASHPKCRCSRLEISRYLKKLSQPILERIDLHVEAEPVELYRDSSQEERLRERQSEEERRSRVNAAVQVQYERQGKQNAFLSFDELKGQVDSEGEEHMKELSKRGYLSARSLVRLMRVGRTIADLSQSEFIAKSHLEEAGSYQALEKIWRFVEGRT